MVKQYGTASGNVKNVTHNPSICMINVKYMYGNDKHQIRENYFLRD